VSRACTVCTHPDAVLINEALIIDGTSNRAVARQYELSKDALRRHREHIPQLLLEASQAMEVADADDLLSQVRDLQHRALTILDQAEDAGELRTALAAIAQARSNLELLGRLAGELQQAGTINIHVHPQWLQLRALIFEALEPHPQARGALLTVLAQLEAS
jgi:hypothetical protein